MISKRPKVTDHTCPLYIDQNLFFFFKFSALDFLSEIVIHLSHHRSKAEGQICVFQRTLVEASRHELQQTGSWRKGEEEKNRKRACDSLDDEVKEEGPARKRGKRNTVVGVL